LANVIVWVQYLHLLNMIGVQPLLFVALLFHTIPR
jgi:hypothetical protein